MIKPLLFLLFVAALSLEMAATTAAQVAFSPPTSLGLTGAAASAHAAMAVADIDGGGTADLVILSRSGTVSVLLGNGLRGVAQRVDSVVRVDADSVVVGDVNGDGKVDLIIGSTSAQTVSVLLGDGRGGFSLSAEVPFGPFNTGGSQILIAAGDLNGDGNADLVVGIPTSPPKILVVLADGAGGLGRRMGLVPSGELTAMALGDLDGDGHLDLVTGDGTGAVSMFRGNGEGSFGPRTDYRGTGGGPVLSLVIADLNADGKLDVIASMGPLNPLIAVFLGDGHGRLSAPSERAVAGIPRTLAVADFDGDGRLDLAYSSGLTAGVLFGDGRGGFIQAIAVSTGSQDDEFTHAVAVVDMDGDGKPDLVALNDLPADVVVLLNTPSSVWFAPVTSLALGDFPNVPSDAFVGDFNGDGKADLVFAKPAATTLSVLLGDGTGRFVTAFDLPTNGDDHPTVRVVGDFNGDGRLDLVVGYANSDRVSIFLGRGNGTFDPSIDFMLGHPVGNIAVGDVDRDGKTDLVVSYPDVPMISVLLGGGTGQFPARRNVPLPALARGIVLADVNVDGTLDLVVGTFPHVSVLLGDGTGAFPTRRDVPVGGTPASAIFTVGDVNGDGRPDLVVAVTAGMGAFDTSSGAVLLGDGTGAFAPARTFQPGKGGDRLSLIDIDGDGRPDLVMTLGSHVSIRLGDGAGGFDHRLFCPTGAAFAGGSSAVADINGDGRPDVVVPTSSPNTLALLLNTSRSAVRVGLWTNRTRFGPGETLVSTIEVESPGLHDVVADLYAGAVLPDGDTVVFFTDATFSSFATGRLSNPASFRSFAAGVDLSSAFTFSRIRSDLYRGLGPEPAGGYRLFLVVARAGAFANGRIDAGDILGLTVSRVDFVP